MSVSNTSPISSKQETSVSNITNLRIFAPHVFLKVIFPSFEKGENQHSFKYYQVSFLMTVFIFYLPFSYVYQCNKNAQNLKILNIYKSTPPFPPLSQDGCNKIYQHGENSTIDLLLTRHVCTIASKQYSNFCNHDTNISIKKFKVNKRPMDT